MIVFNELINWLWVGLAWLSGRMGLGSLGFVGIGGEFDFVANEGLLGLGLDFRGYALRIPRLDLGGG